MTAAIVAFRSAVMTLAGGLAAGLMVGVVGFELLPESLQRNSTRVMSTPAPLFVGGSLPIADI